MKYCITELVANDAPDICLAEQKCSAKCRVETIDEVRKRIGKAQKCNAYKWFIVRDATGTCVAVGSYTANGFKVYWVRLTEYATNSSWDKDIVDFVKDQTASDADVMFASWIPATHNENPVFGASTPIAA